MTDAEIIEIFSSPMGGSRFRAVPEWWAENMPRFRALVSAAQGRVVEVDLDSDCGGCLLRFRLPECDTQLEGDEPSEGCPLRSGPVTVRARVTP